VFWSSACGWAHVAFFWLSLHADHAHGRGLERSPRQFLPPLFLKPHGARSGLNRHGEGLQVLGKRRPGAVPVTGGLPAGNKAGLQGHREVRLRD
jgi:hypothetical protein